MESRGACLRVEGGGVLAVSMLPPCPVLTVRKGNLADLRSALGSEVVVEGRGCPISPAQRGPGPPSFLRQQPVSSQQGHRALRVLMPNPCRLPQQPSATDRVKLRLPMLLPARRRCPSAQQGPQALDILDRGLVPDQAVLFQPWRLCPGRDLDLSLAVCSSLLASPRHVLG